MGLRFKTRLMRRWSNTQSRVYGLRVGTAIAVINVVIVDRHNHSLELIFPVKGWGLWSKTRSGVIPGQVG
jgi:Na+-transporting NADH:ubiquinone oxidoreductase subunit NqrC